jgi:hypothetical protein
MMRVTPVSPTNMWCASSVSMKRQVRESGSKPDCASASSCILPSRSVKKVNMKNDSQSGVFSLKAPSMRGVSRSPERRCNSASASSRPSVPKYFCSRYTIAQRWRPSSTFTWNRLRMS